MKRLILLISILVSTKAFAQYPNPLPGSGSLSVQQIAAWMQAAGEISSTSNVSLSGLNAASHLNKHLLPFSIMDWYGYSKIIPPPDPSNLRNLNLIFSNGYHNFFGNHNSGYPENSGYLKIKDNTTGNFVIISTSGGNSLQVSDPIETAYIYCQVVNDNNTITLVYHDNGTVSIPQRYEFGGYINNKGDLGQFATLIPNTDITYTIPKSSLNNTYGEPSLIVNIQKK